MLRTSIFSAALIAMLAVLAMGPAFAAAPFKVNDTIPADGAVDVPLNSDVTIVWNRDVDCSTVNDTSITITPGSWDSWTCTTPTNQAVFTPSGQAGGTTYTVQVSAAIRDAAGEAMKSAYSMSYATEGSTAIDADTLDGLDSADFALATDLAAKADVNHNHDGVYQKHYSNVLVVSLDGNGDFTSPVDAMAAITDASASNRYLVKVMPGVYDIGNNSVIMKEYVDIEGSGENATVITGTVLTRWTYSRGTVTGASNAEIRFLTVENTGTDPNSGNYFFAIANIGTSPRITHVTARSEGAAYNKSAICNLNSAAVITDVKAIASGGTSLTCGIYDYDSGATLRNVVVEASGDSITEGIFTGGPNALGLTVTNATVRSSGSWRVHGIYSNAPMVLTNVEATASGGQNENQALRLAGLQPATMTNVIAVAKDGLTNYGLWGNWSDVTIERSTIDGEILNGGYPLRIGASRLTGPVSGSGNTCVASYDASFAPLDALCQ